MDFGTLYLLLFLPPRTIFELYVCFRMVSWPVLSIAVHFSLYFVRFSADYLWRCRKSSNVTRNLALFSSLEREKKIKKVLSTKKFPPEIIEYVRTWAQEKRRSKKNSPKILWRFLLLCFFFVIVIIYKDSPFFPNVFFSLVNRFLFTVQSIRKTMLWTSTYIKSSRRWEEEKKNYFLKLKCFTMVLPFVYIRNHFWNECIRWGGCGILCVSGQNSTFHFNFLLSFFPFGTVTLSIFSFHLTSSLPAKSRKKKK